MAEINTAAPQSRTPDRRRSKKASTRVDLTAMVDLGFLLITFFMLATTFSKPKTMEVNMPSKETEATELLKESESITILLGERDKVYTYTDAENPVIDSTDFSRDGIRRVLLERKRVVEANWGQDEMVVLIKSMPHARYRNLVDALDEMSIVGIKRYAIVKTDAVDDVIIAQVGATKQ